MLGLRICKRICFRRQISREKTTVAVAMSGGIDSSAVAMILKDKGYDCIGIFMKNWDSSDEYGRETCTIDQDRLHMKEVCGVLNIPSFEVDFSKEYWNEVFSPLLDAYKGGMETPNPDVFCNRFVKFHHLKKYVNEKLGVKMLATGHYARVRPGVDDKPPELMRGIDFTKDQSYFLSLLKSDQLHDVMFPLGEMTKTEVRAAVAHRFQGLAVLTKPESMGICFVGERSLPSFLGEYMNFTPGRFIDIDTGAVLGTHKGKEYFTVGQRVRLPSGVSVKCYVAAKASTDKILLNSYFSTAPADIAILNSDLLVAQGPLHPALYSQSTRIASSRMNWVVGTPPTALWQTLLDVNKESFRCSSKCRYNEPMIDCSVRLERIQGALTSTADYDMVIQFDQPSRSLTPGQILVFYKDDLCLGGAVIGPQ